MECALTEMTTTIFYYEGHNIQEHCSILYKRATTYIHMKYVTLYLVHKKATALIVVIIFESFFNARFDS